MPPKLDKEDIKDLRSRAKMTQEEMAECLGVTKMTIIRWEHGRARPSQLAIRQLHRLHKKVEGL